MFQQFIDDWTFKKIQNGKSLIKWQNQNLNHVKRMDNIGHTPDLIRTIFMWILHGLLAR